MRRLLVIDDSALIRHAAQLSLEQQSWSVAVAESGAQGLELAAAERPDAVLLDVEMPDIDGPATLERLRSDDTTREIPVAFLTGKAEEEDRRRLTALGAVAVIAKPFDPAALAGQVAAALGWDR